MANALRKVGITVLKDKSGTDLARVPASGVDVKFYKRGVISDRVQSLASGAGRTLYFRVPREPLVIGDVLQKTTDATITVTVTALPNAASATVTIAGGTLVLATNDRIFLVGPGGRVPTQYTDPLGVTSSASLLTDANGYVQAYLKERQADVLIGMVSGGVTASYREAELSGDDENGIYAANYDTLQEAIDAVPNTLGNRAGTVYLPAGEFLISTTLLLDKAVRLVGAGKFATALYFDSGKNTDVIRITDGDCVIEHLTIGYVGAPGSGTGRGIVIDADVVSINNCCIRDVVINDAPSWGIAMTGNNGGTGTYASHVLIENVTISNSRSGGALSCGARSFLVKVVSSIFGQNAGGVGPCIYAASPTNLDIDTCEIAPGTNTKAVLIERAASGLGAAEGPQNVRIANCDIETIGGTTAYLVHIKDGDGICVQSNNFYTADDGIHYEDCAGVLDLGNVFTNMVNHDILLTDCVDTVILGTAGATSGFVRRDVRVDEAGSTTGTTGLYNGLVRLPSYTTGGTPAFDANERPNGSTWLDTTTGKVNTYIAGVAVPLH